MAVNPTPPDNDAIMVNLTLPAEPPGLLATMSTLMEVDSEPAMGTIPDADSINMEPSTAPKSDLGDVNTSDIYCNLPTTPQPLVSQ